MPSRPRPRPLLVGGSSPWYCGRTRPSKTASIFFCAGAVWLLRRFGGKLCADAPDWSAYLPDATQHLARFTQAILRGPAPLSPGIRELIAAYTSVRNDCPF